MREGFNPILGEELSGIDHKHPANDDEIDGSILLEKALIAPLRPNVKNALTKHEATTAVRSIDNVPIDPRPLNYEAFATDLNEKDITDEEYQLSETDIIPGPATEQEQKDIDETNRVRGILQRIRDTPNRNSDHLTDEFEVPTPKSGKNLVDIVQDPSDIYHRLNSLYPEVQLDVDGTPTGGIFSKNKRQFDSLFKTDPGFRSLLQELRKKNSDVFVAKPKSGVRRFFEKIGLAAGLIGATGAMGTSLENRNSDDTRAAQINAMSNLDTPNTLPEGQIDFESIPEDIFDLKDPKTTEIIAGLAQTGNIERVKINPSVDAQVLSKNGVTYVRLHNKITGRNSDGMLSGTHLIPDANHTIQREINRMNIDANIDTYSKGFQSAELTNADIDKKVQNEHPLTAEALEKAELNYQLTGIKPTDLNPAMVKEWSDKREADAEFGNALREADAAALDAEREATANIDRFLKIQEELNSQDRKNRLKNPSTEK